MRIIKKLDLYLLINFLGTFLVTLFICVFILLMQFVWMHVNDLVGKGVGWSVLFEFFIYAAATILPDALPLAILLASLILFGNIGENFELTAMKASGISLFRVMLPIFCAAFVISVGSFLFSNNIIPRVQVKLWSLIFSLRQKSPELDIPEGEFYSQLHGYNMYVNRKSPRTGILYDLMIYDYSSGFKNAKVMMADSGKLLFTDDKKYLLLCLYSGESFENLSEQQQKAIQTIKNVPYRRETFSYKSLLIDFDTELNRLDDAGLKSQHIAKNVSQLLHSSDSVKHIIEKKENEICNDLITKNYFGREQHPNNRLDTLKENSKKPKYDIDSLFATLNYQQQRQALQLAVDKANAKKNQIFYNSLTLRDNHMYIRKHMIEFYRKITLSLACLVFFFIGAPLGAIIRKGGIGFPIIISFVFFILYYIINNIGYKMAKEFVLPIWGGAWLATFIIFPIGIWITFKATTDSNLFNVEVWLSILTKIKQALCKFVKLLHSQISRQTLPN